MVKIPLIQPKTLVKRAFVAGIYEQNKQVDMDLQEKRQ